MPIDIDIQIKKDQCLSIPVYVCIDRYQHLWILIDTETYRELLIYRHLYIHISIDMYIYIYKYLHACQYRYQC